MLLARTSSRLLPQALGSQFGATASRSMVTKKYEEPHYRLVLVRHGESQWNQENRFTGWVDVPLSAKGEEEAKAGGKLLKEEGIKFDKAYTSYLKRAIKTCWLVLEQMEQMYIPIVPAWQLNERHYGALSGLDKQETVDKHGKDKVLIWRRSYDTPPPDCEKDSEYYPGNDPRYAHLSDKELPRCESLHTTLLRVLPYWQGQIGPEIKSGKTVLVAAHGNSLRALVKSLDDIDESVITELNIPTGIPLVYDLDRNLKPIKHPKAFAPLRGRYLGDQDYVRDKIEGVKKQTK